MARVSAGKALTRTEAARFDDIQRKLRTGLPPARYTFPALLSEDPRHVGGVVGNVLQISPKHTFAGGLDSAFVVIRDVPEPLGGVVSAGVERRLSIPACWQTQEQWAAWSADYDAKIWAHTRRPVTDADRARHCYFVAFTGDDRWRCRAVGQALGWRFETDGGYFAANHLRPELQRHDARLLISCLKTSKSARRRACARWA